MTTTKAFALSIALAGGALTAETGLAQAPPELPAPVILPADSGTTKELAPDGYGTTGSTVVKIHASAFRSQCGADVLTSFWNTGITYRQSGNASCMLHAPVYLPAGAVITQIGFDGYDVDAALDIAWGVYYVSQSIANTTGSIAWYAQPTTTGWFSATGALPSPHTVDSGNYYFALVDLKKLGQDVRIKGMRIVYKLQVSPAPATATFVDVPTDHWAFKFVEALAAAGITGGCAAGQYCPNNPVSRAEMAVFLSEALGLHWPN